MRPIIHAIQPALCDRIIDEARHILATTGMEIRGELLRQQAAGQRASTKCGRHASALSACGN